MIARVQWVGKATVAELVVLAQDLSEGSGQDAAWAAAWAGGSPPTLPDVGVGGRPRGFAIDRTTWRLAFPGECFERERESKSHVRDGRCSLFTTEYWEAHACHKLSVTGTTSAQCGLPRVWLPGDHLGSGPPHSSGQEHWHP